MTGQQMPDIIGLAGMIPDFERAIATYDKVKAVVNIYVGRLHAVLPPRPQTPADITTALAALAVFVPELKPLVPQIADAIATIEKAAAMLAPAPAPAPAPPDPPTAWP